MAAGGRAFTRLPSGAMTSSGWIVPQFDGIAKGTITRKQYIVADSVIA